MIGNYWYIDGQRCAEQEFSRREWCYRRDTLYATKTSAGLVISAGAISLGQMIRGGFSVEQPGIDLGVTTIGM